MADINLSPKQSIAWGYLMDKTTTEINFGGGVSGGKSFLASVWLTTMCLTYPGIRTLLGRTVLSTLKQTSLNTLFEVMRNMDLKEGNHYKYNAQSNIITFSNGSEIILKDLQYQPSDPNFESLAGLEITCAVLEEASQMSFTAFNIVKSRLRFKLTEYDLVGKILLTCNPGNNWIKKEFYIPYVQNNLPKHRVFIPSLVTDNPHTNQNYMEMLNTLPDSQRRRLLGDWNFEDESDAIFSFDKITDSLFKFSPNPDNRMYMSIDVARFGLDRSVVMIWSGMVLIECFTYTKLSTTELYENIKELIDKYGIDTRSIIVDSDGVGSGVADMIKGVSFVNNAKPLFGQNYTNLKSQCYIRLSELFKEGKISINLINPEITDQLTQELLAVKLRDVDNDAKIGIISKDEMKKKLGRSNDLSDALAYRIYFDLKAGKSTGRYALQFTNY
jgi:hypothetical protein